MSTATAEPSAGTRTRIGSDLLVVTNVSKRFGITQALDGVSVTFRAGEVHALMGENGAGKSTLGKAIAGLHKPDTGSIVLDGRELRLGDIDDAFGAGVRIVHQELAQCPNLSVAENLCLHDLPTLGGVLSRRMMEDRASRLLSALAPEIDVRAPLGSLAPGRRQIVQIAASLEERVGPDGRPEPAARVIIFDEPTSSLSVAEADRLGAIVRDLASKGLLCIYVSHRMGEIFSVCDRVTVLRDGKFVATSEVKAIGEADLVAQMIGRRIDSSKSYRSGRSQMVEGDRRPHAFDGEPVLLEVSGLSSPGRLKNVSLKVHKGEVLGVGGLVGSGRSELLDAIFGLDGSASGGVSIPGRTFTPGRPRERIVAGVGYVPEDRRLQGLFFLLGVDENIIAPKMPLLAKLGVRLRSAERNEVAERVKKFQVKTARYTSLPGELSGGNQQKLLLARWLAKETCVLLLDEPTRGIDVGTKTEIYRLVRAAADEGLAVLLVSSEMPELLALSDRIVVMCDGEITGELIGEKMTQENILRLATVRH